MPSTTDNKATFETEWEYRLDDGVLAYRVEHSSLPGSGEFVQIKYDMSTNVETERYYLVRDHQELFSPATIDYLTTNQWLNSATFSMVNNTTDCYYVTFHYSVESPFSSFPVNQSLKEISLNIGFKMSMGNQPQVVYYLFDNSPSNLNVVKAYFNSINKQQLYVNLKNALANKNIKMIFLVLKPDSTHWAYIF
jgi:hypothetical protein